MSCCAYSCTQYGLHTQYMLLTSADVLLCLQLDTVGSRFFSDLKIPYWWTVAFLSHRSTMCTVHYSVVQCSAIQYSTVQYSAVQCSAIQYSTVQYSAPFSFRLWVRFDSHSKWVTFFYLLSERPCFGFYVQTVPHAVQIAHPWLFVAINNLNYFMEYSSFCCWQTCCGVMLSYRMLHSPAVRCTVRVKLAMPRLLVDFIGVGFMYPDRRNRILGTDVIVKQTTPWSTVLLERLIVP